MASYAIGDKIAFGAPGQKAKWACANKEGVGTSASLGSRTWFTLAEGILTEIFYPTIDRPQTRDLQFLFADGAEVFLEEKKDLEHKVERLKPSQGYRVISADRAKRVSITKEIICHPMRACVLMRAEVGGDEKFLKTLQAYVLCAPHLNDGGERNNGYVIEDSGQKFLAAEKDGTWVVIGASCGFKLLSCGYVGTSDGYTDLARNFNMLWEFDQAPAGNVALTGQLDLSRGRTFTLGIAFGETVEGAVANLLQSLSTNFEDDRKTFVSEWERASSDRRPLGKASSDAGRLYDASYALLKAGEDKTYQGAFIASPSTPFGESRTDKKGKGGYHIVWTRDMVESSMGLLAAGDTLAPLRTLINIAARQHEDGSFAQNSWVDGNVFRDNIQLDEIAFPIILAARLSRDKLLGNFDPSTMAKRAAKCLLIHGPITPEERWEEVGGYSPSTLAAIISGMISCAYVLRDSGETAVIQILEEYADFLYAHIEEWTVTTNGSLRGGGSRYFTRLNPAKPGEARQPGSINHVELRLPDQPPGAEEHFPARDVVDAGFLQLVRYGIYAWDNPLIKESLEIVDANLKVSTPKGICFLRYNHDGYGQKPDGGDFGKWGVGGAWPLLSGERAHYELAAEGEYKELITAMEQFASNDLLPEQVWPREDHPDANLLCGQPVTSAIPLFWAHSEYIRLLRSCSDKRIFDLIPEVESRYVKQKPTSRVEYWMPKHPIVHIRSNCTLRICAPEPFALRWSSDQWANSTDSSSGPSALGFEYLDLGPASIHAGIEFTFFWSDRGEWEGKNHSVVPE